MMTVEFMTYAPEHFEPDWMKSERYEYCEIDLASKVRFSDMWSSFIKKFSHN